MRDVDAQVLATIHRKIMLNDPQFEALAKRSRLFAIQRSTCMLSEMSRAFGHLAE